MVIDKFRHLFGGSRIFSLLFYSLLLTLVSHTLVYFTPIKVTSSVEVNESPQYKQMLEKQERLLSENKTLTIDELEYLEEETNKIIAESLDGDLKEDAGVWRAYRQKAAIVTWLPWLVFFILVKLRNLSETVIVLIIPVISGVVLFFSWIEVLVIIMAVGLSMLTTRNGVGTRS